MNEEILLELDDDQYDLAVDDDTGQYLDFDLKLIVNQFDTDPYEGDYTVTPILGSDIILPTTNKRMVDDLTVKEIPITQTSNLFGGKTVVIG